ncbi:MAG: hypothetical protein C4524_07450, partial [Candidatus Zixiibacteriota bacterium]
MVSSAGAAAWCVSVVNIYLDFPPPVPYIDGMKIALILLLLLPLGAGAGGPNRLLDRLPDEVPPGFFPGEMGPAMLIMDGATNAGASTNTQTLQLKKGW